MNLLLRPLNDINDVTWSIVISLLILLAGVTYYIYTIMNMAYAELNDAGPNQSDRCGSESGDSTPETET